MAGRAGQVRVVGLEKEMVGVMSLVEALDMADEADVDVVMINPQADPPVVRLVDYSKFRYEQSKAVKDASKRQREARCALFVFYRDGQLASVRATCLND